MPEALRDWLRRHPRWLGAVLLFCLYMTFVFMPYDFLGKLFLRDVAQAEEVWFGIVLRGWAAKATEPLHWAIYAALAWGLWKDRPWALPAAAVYTAQVAIGMLVWSVSALGGARGLALGAAAFVLFGALALALWRARPRATA